MSPPPRERQREDDRDEQTSHPSAIHHVEVTPHEVAAAARLRAEPVAAPPAIVGAFDLVCVSHDGSSLFSGREAAIRT
jgi:hypothetical protein